MHFLPGRFISLLKSSDITVTLVWWNNYWPIGHHFLGLSIDPFPISNSLTPHSHQLFRDGNEKQRQWKFTLHQVVQYEFELCVFTWYICCEHYLPVLVRDAEALDRWCCLFPVDKPLSLTLPPTRLSSTSENSLVHEFNGMR